MSELPWFYNIFNPEMIEEIKKKARERAVPIEDLPEDDDWVNVLCEIEKEMQNERH